MTTGVISKIWAFLNSQTYKRSGIPQNAGRFFGGAIPVTARNFWNQNATVNGNGVAGATGLTLAYVTDPNNNGTWLSAHHLAYDCTGLRLVYCNTGQDPTSVATHSGNEPPPWSTTDQGGQLTIKAGVEIVNANATAKEYQVFFGGKISATLDEGAMIISDPINVDVRKANRAYIRIATWTAVSPGKAWPIMQEQMALAPADGYTTNVDGSAPGSSLAGYTANTTQMYGPIMVLGTVTPRNRPVIGMWCDSVLNGAKNTLKDNVLQGNNVTCNDWGPLDFANSPGTFPVITAPTFGLVKCARVNMTAQNEAGNSNNNEAVYFSIRHSMLMACTHIFIHLGVNDINNGTTAVALEGYLTTICNYCRLLGASPILCTIMPRTTSSDNWTAAGNQTLDPNNAVRVAVNTWIRGTALNTGVCDQVCETANQVEVNASNVLTQNGGFWLTSGVIKHYTTDGIHLSYDGNNLVSAAFTPILNGLTV